jgi:signal transduction histidine kinase
MDTSFAPALSAQSAIRSRSVPALFVTVTDVKTELPPVISNRDMSIEARNTVECLMAAWLEQAAEEIRRLKMYISEESRRQIEARKRADTERANLQQQLRQAAKMEAIGRFASGIAHDFNNVLGTIIPFAESLCRDATLNSSAKERAQTVFTAAMRGRHIADQILAYCGNQRGERTPTDLCRSVAETLRLMQGSLPAGVTLQVTMPDSPLQVMGDATQLHQVVLNLCTNAIHAMKAGGTLRVAVAALDVDAERALSHGTLKPCRYIAVTVEDSGCGIDEATLARIFEPFFTTRKSGRGTGLGLALVHEIVTDFDGAIDVSSAPGEGSTFSVYLPMADAAEAVAAL